MLRYTLTAIACLMVVVLSAQNNSISPYSFFGIGDLSSSATVENQMMGRLSMYTDSIHINFNNPAAYGKLRLTTYTAAVSHREIRLESFTESQNSSVSNLEYLALAFPVSPSAGVGLGIMPYSAIGYNLLSESTNSNGNTVTNQFSGEGGLNRVHLTFGFKAARNLYLGATVNYNFGTLDNTRIQNVEDVQFGTIDRRESRITGYDFNYGLTYSPKLTEKLTLFTSATVNTQANLVSENNQRIGSYNQTTGREIEVVEVDLAAQNLKNTEIKVPTTATIGLGIGEDKRWFVGGEYSMQQFSDFQNEFLQAEEATYQDVKAMALGAYYIPDFASLSSYLNRVTYRAGVRYEETGLVVRDRAINNFGITFGLGLPLGNDFSNLNVGFELGRRGTTVADLIEENYFKVNIGLSFNARWFRKRKIN